MKMLFGIHNRKESNEASTICFEVRIQRKNKSFIMEEFHQKLMEVMLDNGRLSSIQNEN